MRLFLGYLLFDMLTRSVLLLTPVDDNWPSDLSLGRRPAVALPSPEDLRRVEAGEDPKHNSAAGRYLASLKSAGRFFIPIPDEQTRENIDSIADTGKYVLTWLGTRQDFLGGIIGFDQDFPMFSPNVGVEDTVGRLVLIYEDGTRREHRLRCDPEDLTSYSHWFEEKILQTACKVHRDLDTRLGYCHMIAKREPTNADGSPLVKIQVYKVTYYYPTPYEDAYEVLKQQTGPPADQVQPPFWEYDVATGKGRDLEQAD